MMKKILVIDESKAIRQSIAFVLTESGWDVAEWDGMRESPRFSGFDLIILDVNVKNENGNLLIETINGGSCDRIFPLIVLSTESQKGRREEECIKGISGWLIKPLSKDKIIKAVKKVCG